MNDRMPNRPLTLRAARAALREHADAVRVAHSQRYFRTGPGEYAEGDRFLGIPMPDLRRLVSRYAALPDNAIRALLGSPWHEERMLAVLILARRAERGDAERAARIYLDHTDAINNWDLVDVSAPHVLGRWLERGDRTVLDRLARSESLWERRMAMLTTLYFIKNDEFEDALRVARALRNDEHDLIHKAVGWMLREIGKRDESVLRRFLGQHAAHMPRTMLRYAVERFPAAERKKWLAVRRVREGG